VGEAVAAVIAETKLAAVDAAEAVDVTYEGLPAVLDIRDAIAPGAALLAPDVADNISAEMAFGDAAAVDAAFAGAVHVVKIEAVNQRLVANAMEPRSIMAVPGADGRLTVYKASQAPTLAQQFLSQAVLGEPEEQIRVVVGDIGGGFGMKASVHNEEAIAAYAARKLNRGVKYIAERGEEFSNSVHGRDHFTVAEMALDAEGKILGVKVDTLANLGAYVMPVGESAARHVSSARHAYPRARRAYEHHVGGGLSRRRPAGEYFHHRAADGRGRRRDRHGPGRIAPQKSRET
jgi:carbon-monoxide dehydrogenase large subunit